MNSIKNQKQKVVGKWLRTDEHLELVRALEFGAECAERAKRDTTHWKWVIISMHSALQGACVCALRGVDTAGLNVLTKTSSREMYEWLDIESRKPNPKPMPREELASMLELFARVRNNKFLEDPYRLVVSGQMIQDIETLNALRNEFIHFTPKSFSVESSGLPRILGQCCDAIEHLTIKQPTFWHHLTGNKIRRIKGALNRLRR